MVYRILELWDIYRLYCQSLILTPLQKDGRTSFRLIAKHFMYEIQINYCTANHQPAQLFSKVFFFHPWNGLKVEKITKSFCRCCCCYKMACNRFTQWYAKKGYPVGMHLCEKLGATREKKAISLIGEPLLICRPWHFDPK